MRFVSSPCLGVVEVLPLGASALYTVEAPSSEREVRFCPPKSATTMFMHGPDGAGCAEAAGKMANRNPTARLVWHVARAKAIHSLPPAWAVSAEGMIN